MLTGKYSEFYKQICKYIPPEKIYTDELKTLAYGIDAGFYRLVPKIVIKASSEEEIIKILSLSKEFIGCIKIIKGI